MRTKLFLCILAICLFMFNICYATEFSDVPKEHWAYEYINNLSNESIINGFEDGTFRPSETLTKAQFIKLMVSSDKLLVQKMNDLSFDSTVDRQWYENYFDVAEEYYLLPNGYNKTDLNSSISRKDMAEILSNFIKFVSVYNSLDNNGQAKLKQELNNNPEFINNAFSEYLTELDTKLNDSFADVLNLDKRTQENIFLVKDLGIINGYEDGTFRPNNYVTRAEASKVISKYIDESSVVIIISNMIYNGTQDVISDGINQLDAVAMQMFNQNFEMYSGTNFSKYRVKTLIEKITVSNINADIEHKISIELIDSNGQVTLDNNAINAIDVAINNENSSRYDISFSKDSSGYINKAIIKENDSINNTK